MKHLKVKAELNGDEAIIKILEQTHVRSDFGNARRCEGSQPNRAFFHGGYMLCSGIVPCAGSGDTLWVCGEEGQAGNHCKIKIPAEKWPKLRAAVEAYNAWGATQ